MANGILNIYKEAGYTSHDVVAKLRGILKQKKIGHTGTLDPDAVGVLPVCLGKATKVCSLLSDTDKTYRCVLLLGRETDTQDISGAVLKEREVTVQEEQVRQAVFGFLGEYDQTPPMYSALKVNGKKLYELARAGKEVERAKRRVVIHSIQILEVALPRVTLEVTCSKGTYIRTLCHDIGGVLGCGGCMEKLTRIRAAGFSVEDSHTLSQVEQAVKDGKLQEYLLPIDTVFAPYPQVYAAQECRKLLENGNCLPLSGLMQWKKEWEGTDVRLYTWDSRFAGIYRFQEAEGDLRPVKLFLEKD